MFINLKKYLPIILLIILACVVRLWFVFSINYTAEDSFITFQFARALSRGDGFAINPGHPVYGTTTPLLTILLAGWLLMSKDIVTGARILDVLGTVGGMLFLYLAISKKREALVALFIMAISARLYIEEMQGMEMPLTFLFLAASLYGIIRKKPYFSGIMAGLMLWARIDTVIWVGCLFLVVLLDNFQSGLKYFISTSAIYLPWVIFAWIYFGSPIPLTVTAKLIAYGIHSPPPIDHLQTIIRYVSWPIFILSLFSIPSILKIKSFWIFPLFIVIEIPLLVLTGTTYFYRYFYLLLLVCYILLGFGIVYWSERIIGNSTKLKRYLLPITLMLIFIFSWNSVRNSTDNHSLRNGVLQHMGEWINTNTPPGSTVLLEPLGYVGWYAYRIMIDEVGLVTPEVVKLDGRLPASEFFRVFWPDYVVWKCGAGGTSRAEIMQYYSIVQNFGNQNQPCVYEIWKRMLTLPEIVN